MILPRPERPKTLREEWEEFAPAPGGLYVLMWVVGVILIVRVVGS